MNTGMIRVLSENSDFLVCLKPVGVDSEHALPALLAPDHGGSIFPVHRLDQGLAASWFSRRTGNRRRSSPA